MSKAFNKAGLDELISAGCQHACCAGKQTDVLFINPLCHRAPVEVSYKKGTGILRVTCAECNALVCEIKVGE